MILDEDAFVLSNERLEELVAWAAQSGHAAVGVPDGGVFPRRPHNPNALNLFFNVLDLEAIRRVWDADACARWMDRGSEMTEVWPPASLLNPAVPYLFDDYEPYYCFYFWLADAGLSTGYLDARMHSDGLSAIVLDHTAEPIVAHTWYAREFDTPGPDARADPRRRRVRARRRGPGIALARPHVSAGAWPCTVARERSERRHDEHGVEREHELRSDALRRCVDQQNEKRGRPEDEDRPRPARPPHDEGDEPDDDPEHRRGIARRDPVQDLGDEAHTLTGWKLRVPGAHLRDDLAVALLSSGVVPHLGGASECA